MNDKKEQFEDLYAVLASSKDVDEVAFPILIKILKTEKIQNCLEFLQQRRQVESKVIQKYINKKVGQNNIMKIAKVIKKIMNHEFNEMNYSQDEYQKNKQDLITKISYNQKIIEFLKFLVRLTALDERYIQCGSNSLHLVVQMKVDLNNQSFENIRICNTSLLGANLARCDLSGSEFDNVIISGMNLNGAKLFNCKWRNIKIYERNTLYGYGKSVNQVCFSPDSKSLVSCSDNSIHIWDVSTGKIKSIILGERIVNSVCYSHNNTTLAFSSKKFVYLWNQKTGKQLSKLDGHSDYVRSVSFSPDGATLASFGSYKFILLWDIKTRQQKSKLDGHSNYVNSICFSPDSTILASASHDKSIRLWDVQTGQQIAKLDGHTHFVYSVNFSHDGTTLASGSYDKSIRLWDVKTGQLTAILDGHKGCVSQINFSPDGTILASSEDNLISLWDVQTGQQKAILDGHTHYVSSINFSPDGSTLVSGSWDKSIRLWNVKIGLQILFSDNLQRYSTQVQPKICINKNHQERAITHNNLYAQRALISKGEFLNYQGLDLKPLFKSKGSCILENQIEKKQN